MLHALELKRLTSGTTTWWSRGGGYILTIDGTTWAVRHQGAGVDTVWHLTALIIGVSDHLTTCLQWRESWASKQTIYRYLKTYFDARQLMTFCLLTSLSLYKPISYDQYCGIILFERSMFMDFVVYPTKPTNFEENWNINSHIGIAYYFTCLCMLHVQTCHSHRYRSCHNHPQKFYPPGKEFHCRYRRLKNRTCQIHTDTES